MSEQPFESKAVNEFEAYENRGPDMPTGLDQIGKRQEDGYQDTGDRNGFKAVPGIGGGDQSGGAEWEGFSFLRIRILPLVFPGYPRIGRISDGMKSCSNRRWASRNI